MWRKAQRGMLFGGKSALKTAQFLSPGLRCSRRRSGNRQPIERSLREYDREV